MNADERPHAENGEEGAPGKAEQGALGDCEPEGHSEGRDRHSKEHQGGRFNGNDLSQDRGEREQEDEQVILEEGIQRAVRGGGVDGAGSVYCSWDAVYCGSSGRALDLEGTQRYPPDGEHSSKYLQRRPGPRDAGALQFPQCRGLADWEDGA